MSPGELHGKLKQALENSTQAIAQMKFGKNKPQAFMQAITDFLGASTPASYAEDQAYINRIYAAVNTIQGKVLMSEAVDDEKQALSALLYAPERGRFLAPGMQTAKLFGDAVEKTVLQVKKEIFGESLKR